MNKRAARPLVSVALLMLVIGGLACSPAQATPDALDHPLHHGSSAVWIGFAALVLGGACLAGAARRRRNATILALTLLVVVFGLESAIHSVHHLSDPEAAASCVVLSASHHEPGTCADTPDVGTPTWTAEPPPAVGPPIVRPLQAFRPHEGRAPPALPAV